MVVTLVQFDEPQIHSDGRAFTAQVRAQQLPGGLWEGWLEFQPIARGDSVSAAPATQQLSRGDLRYWAAGITRQQLAESLTAALQTQTSRQAHNVYEDSPRRDRGARSRTTSAGDTRNLDPVALYEHTGEYALRQVLRELEAPELADIIETMGLDTADVEGLAPTFEDALAERIVAGVQQRVESNRIFSCRPDVTLTN